MIDREKVIKALECRKNAYKRCENPCEETGICHYAKAVRDINGEIYRPFICDRERICTDALALLKEQEAKTGHWISVNDGDTVAVDNNGFPERACYCSECQKYLIASDEYEVYGNYCPNCGAKMSN